MERCPKCGHWMMSYNSQYEEWQCLCHTVIYKNPSKSDCHCSHVIHESQESFNRRLLENNRQGRYSIGPP